MSNVFRQDLLAGKVAVITGGGSGINFAIARKFAQYGAKLALIGRRQERLDTAVAEILKEGGTAAGVAADVRDYEALLAAFNKIASEYRRLDILVCGAAGNFPAKATAMSANAFKAVIDIDLLGTFNACRAAFEHLTRPGASVINISAPQSLLPMSYQSHVCAAKAGVDMITRTLAIEWGPLGIRVNSIVPGPIAGTEGMKRLTPTPHLESGLSKAIPLQRFGEKDDIANLALFLSSDAAQYINGAMVTCDGGASCVGSAIWAEALATGAR